MRESEAEPGHAVEIVGSADTAGPFVFTCEHAGRGLPEWVVDDVDRRFVDDHWGWDVGAGDLARNLARRTGSPAVLSRFSRLVCDPNRDPSAPSFVVAEVDGHALSFNRDVDDAERERRRLRYFEPYHDAVDDLLAARLDRTGAFSLCSIHSFTPVYRGSRREIEVGVLFDDHEEHAAQLVRALSDKGFRTGENVPYSGYEGMVYAARRHGQKHGVVYAELEVRHDLIDTLAKATVVSERVSAALLEVAG